MALKNHEFVNSKGVFQGGGCKAVAFIGAYEAALDNGVCFTEFAGTSAGSIFAALIASGATIDDMKAFVNNLDINTLVKRAQIKKTFYEKAIVKILSCLLRRTINIAPSMVNAIISTLLNRGMCDAHILEEVMEEELKKILRINTQVRFSDLRYPLTIIASDIRNHTIKIWSKKKTPNESVSKAVSCSCAIPGYFKPVDEIYLDGGLLANLPVSFFENNAEDYSNVLAFTLKYENTNDTKGGLTEYMADIMSTVTEGATDIQLSSHHNIFVIPVKTKIGLLDFSSLNKDSKEFKLSIQEGKKSFIDFLNSYQQNSEVKEKPMHSNQYLLKVASCSCEKQDEIICFVDHYKKIFRLFLTILKWRNNSKDISVYIQSNSKYGNTELDYSVRLLSNMGIKVYVVDKRLPLLGYFFHKSQKWRSIIVKKIDKGYRAQYYNSDIEHMLAEAFVNSVKAWNFPCYYVPLSKITLKKIDTLDMIAQLCQVTQYKNSVISFRKINVKSLLFMHDFVYGYKYRAMDELVRLYDKAKLDVFSPAAFVLAEGKQSLITPPIVERHNDEYVVISGLTRLFYAYKQSMEEVTIAVVENCDEETPSDGRFKISELRIKDGPLEIEEISNRQYQNYRYIEQVLRPSVSSLI